MGLFDFLKKKQDPESTVSERKENNKLSYVDKERIMVQRVSLEDMQQFTNFPYQWNRRIEKCIQPHGHPFAYMDLYGTNIDAAKSELRKMNALLSGSHQLSSLIPAGLCIPISEIVFTPSKKYGYTRIMCTPHTFSGEIAQYPASLSFMTNLESEVSTTHGDLFYTQDGKIGKATIYFWRKHKGYFFYYETVNCMLVLSKVELSDTTCGYAPPTVIYKGKHILEMEAKRLAEEKDYAWLQKNIPEKCPKSITGYRRMKTQNTKNYQVLKRLAAEHGREI